MFDEASQPALVVLRVAYIMSYKVPSGSTALEVGDGVKECFAYAPLYRDLEDVKGPPPLARSHFHHQGVRLIYILNILLSIIYCLPSYYLSVGDVALVSYKRESIVDCRRR